MYYFVPMKHLLLTGLDKLEAGVKAQFYVCVYWTV